MQFDFLSHAEHLPFPGPAGRPAAGQDADGRPPHPPGQPVGHVRPQPRRTHAGQAQRRRTGGGLRRLRPGPGHADVRPRTPAPAPADARRRSRPDPHGLLADVLAAGHPGPLLRRGNRDGRGPAAEGPLGRPLPHAVERQRERRLLHRPGRATWWPSRWTATSDRRTSTPRPPNGTRSRCGISSPRSSSATGNARSSAGATSNVIKQPDPAVLAAPLHAAPVPRWLLAHNFGAEPAAVTAKARRRRSGPERSGGAVLLDLFDGENVRWRPTAASTSSWSATATAGSGSSGRGTAGSDQPAGRRSPGISTRRGRHTFRAAANPLQFRATYFIHLIRSYRKVCLSDSFDRQPGPQPGRKWNHPYFTSPLENR